MSTVTKLVQERIVFIRAYRGGQGDDPSPLSLQNPTLDPPPLREVKIGKLKHENLWGGGLRFCDFEN